MTPEDLAEVRLIGMPLGAWQAAQEHYDELFREFTLIASRPSEGAHTVPKRLMALIDNLTQSYGGFNTAAEAELDQALAEGRETIDLTFHVPREAGAATVELARLLDEADEYCRQGTELLTLVTPPGPLAFRNWYLDEFVRQIEGRPPRPWAAAAAPS